MGLYPQPKRTKGKSTSVLKTKRTADKPVDVRRALPGNVIVIHGVNDVGTGYDTVEQGLCKGLEERLHRTFKAGSYRMPGKADKETVETDPDAVFFKRSVDETTDSPVIPFYWGYRELDSKTSMVRGQQVDRYGNRLDKDRTKGGGPFANATSSLPDLWNKGFGIVGDIGGDAIRPLMNCPGRMYMVLAASRLAALISMIRDYDDGETVTVIAHSQGCLVTLTAQAMLASRGLRPADTLILTHPPYGLVDTFGTISTSASHITGGTDAVMAPRYAEISGMQSLHARLQTLGNIVRHVAARKPATNEPEFSTLADHKKHDGVVGGKWQAGNDRDNRGKVYLYFCPQDMTVALDNMQGIGWQGVPDAISGTQLAPVDAPAESTQARTVTLKALQVLGKGFFQRVFTNKLRFDPATRKSGPVLVGCAPPYDYALRVKGEDDHAHVESSGRTQRAHFPVSTWPIDPHDKPEVQRNGIRTITGEQLRKPVEAVLSNTSEITPDKIPEKSTHAKRKQTDRGPCEEVDPIDAAIAPTSQYGARTWGEVRPDPRISPHVTDERTSDEKEVPLTQDELRKMTVAYNNEKNLQGDKMRTIIAAAQVGNTLLATVEESPYEIRQRWQHELSAKSFHGSIIGNKENHQQVTAYDVAIGGGKASSDPDFYAYLCAVADWRLKKPIKDEKARPGILTWENFLKAQAPYWPVELPWRKELIEGNANYYSTGVLPPSLPLPGGRLFEIIIAESVNGSRVNVNNGGRR
ncbi:MAG: DUF3274 domain-containing protein [Burkholderiaceae bacterium]|nr:DUF3274 domain-containing protein [Burkholderiaceae bacterium]